ncbi:hypothetical protein K461DRAFT_282246 [Myriangium duriaei CBS 260.36]|uniref:Uncharacterized protein n=1 Tax=Myriangium duriaei CBS 260.36 TaxID=1168546 RepID=A0A9P4IVU5_9PEZI|nr:hypothetical protein K461DRAFT_282246 [Myriangium duriaei CBS 260.36]
MGDVESNNNGVDRNTSIRSVMTLPAYSAVPRDNEGVIGREGERAGMDTVVEYPETNEQEEDRREEEMESLYQIRLARRREAREREDRRQRRREARERGDEEALNAIRRESRRARRERQETGSAALVTEHESRPRSRRVSAVSYGNLGVARHDGSRVRHNSEESQRPLLDLAGPMEMAEPVRPWMSRESSTSHRRGRSSVTNISMHSYGSEDDSGWSDADSSYETISLHPSRSRPRSQSRTESATRTSSRPSSTFTPGTVAPSTSRATSQSRNVSLSVNTDVQSITASTSSTLDVEPPPYASPIHTRGTSEPWTPRPPQVPPPAARPVSDSPSLPEIERLPSIRITTDTPVDPVPGHKRSYTNFSLRRDSRILGLEDPEQS